MRLIDATLLKGQVEWSEHNLSNSEMLELIQEQPTICRTDRPVCIINDIAVYITQGHIDAMIQYEQEESKKQVVKTLMRSTKDILSSVYGEVHNEDHV